MLEHVHMHVPCLLLLLENAFCFQERVTSVSQAFLQGPPMHLEASCIDAHALTNESLMSWVMRVHIRVRIVERLYVSELVVFSH